MSEHLVGYWLGESWLCAPRLASSHATQVSPSRPLRQDRIRRPHPLADLAPRTMATEEEGGAIERARRALTADPLIDQLRRISRAANVATSISDSAELVRAKLHGLAPLQLVEHMRGSMAKPTPMFKMEMEAVVALEREANAAMSRSSLSVSAPTSARLPKAQYGVPYSEKNCRIPP